MIFFMIIDNYLLLQNDYLLQYISVVCINVVAGFVYL